MFKILFICMANSCRSQMAEGLARYYGDGWLEPFSAGVEPFQLDPRAVQVMGERGIDIADQVSKAVEATPVSEMGMIVTLSTQASGRLPALPVTIHRLHWNVADPTLQRGSEKKMLEAYRHVRDELETKIRGLLPRLQTLPLLREDKPVGRSVG